MISIEGREPDFVESVKFTFDTHIGLCLGKCELVSCNLGAAYSDILLNFTFLCPFE